MSDASSELGAIALKRGVVEGSRPCRSRANIDGAAIAARLARLAPQLRKPRPRAREPRRPARLRRALREQRLAARAAIADQQARWTNAATLSPETAATLGIANGDVVRVLAAREAGRGAGAASSLGQAERTVGLTFGWGTMRGAELARGRGANAFLLTRRDATAPSSTPIRWRSRRRAHDATSRSRRPHRRLEGRDDDILRHAPLALLASGARARRRERRGAERAQSAS